MSELFNLPVLLGVLYSGIRLGAPYLYAALGETYAQRSGVLNLGVDGIMLMGAFSAYYIVFTTGNLLLGLLAATLVGILMGLLMSVVSVTLQAEQGISGIGLYMFGLGLSSLFFSMTHFGRVAIEGFQPIKIPLLGDIPIVGEIFFQHNILVYGAYILVPFAYWVLNRTTFGLKVRAVGQVPQAADTLGVNVSLIRYITVTFGGMLAGISGATLSIAVINLFQQNMTGGMGFIAVALVYFGGWRPLGVFLGAMLFSLVNALQMWIQVKEVNIPSDIAIMLPYILTILTLAFTAKRVREPAALNKPFERGEN